MFGQPDKPAVALDEPPPELGFERGEACRKRRLRDAAGPRRLGEMLLARERHEIAQMAQLHERAASSERKCLSHSACRRQPAAFVM
jgi:hypothetical protein